MPPPQCNQEPRQWLTLQTTDPPQARVRQGPRVLLLLIMGILLCVVGGAVADERPRVQPIISADSHRHQAEGCESTHDGEKDLNALLTHHAYG